MSREKQNMELQNDECNQYSVLMSLYKKEKPEYLKLALESMINQSIKPDEIVLVEDGPLTKELYDVIDEYKEYLYIVKNDENLGLGVSLKKGLKRCKNELVARMDTDDIAKLYRCEKQINYLKEHPECSIVGGQIEEFIGEESNIIGKRIVPCSDKELKEYIKRRCPFNHMTVMFRKKDVLDAGNYEDFFNNEDYILWIKMAMKEKKFANLDEILVTVRVGKDMYQRRGGKKYFQSEIKLQKYLLDSCIISRKVYWGNVVKRFIIQILLPNKLRGLFFRLFARKR